MVEARITALPDLATHLAELSAAHAERNSRAGYFAALYALMTARVAEDAAAARFEDGPRMEHLACHFASRYLDALERHERGEPAPGCWQVSFDAAEQWRPVILQHLLLGMNAHINFDLGIAAAEVAEESGLDAARRDFDEINVVLAELLETVKRNVAAVSPWMGILDALGGRKDDAVVNFSMRRAREAAWRVAEDYAALSASQRPAAEAALDLRIARFARVIVKPGRLLSTKLLAVRLRERHGVAEVIEALGRRV